MIKIIRANKILNSISKDDLINLSNFDSLIKDSKIELNSSDLTIQLLKSIARFAQKNNADLNIYFEKFSEIESLAINSFNSKIEETIALSNASINPNSIAEDLKNLNLEEKFTYAISLLKNERDIILFNEAFNGGYLSIDTLIKRLVINE